MTVLHNQQHLFDFPSDVAYFNCAYNGPRLRATRKALEDAVDFQSRPWEKKPAHFFDDAERIRGLAADVFGGDGEGYAVIGSASYGLSAAARAIEPTLRPGDQILVLAEEFPSNVLPWRRAANETGAVLTAIEHGSPGSLTEAALQALTPGVRVAALGHCRWTDGSLLDLAAVSRRCREIGAVLILDVTQSLGAMPLDLAEIDPDFMVAAGYKWLLCPYGFGLMYVAPRWRNARPLEETWLARNGAEDFAGLVNYREDYRPGARRFDMGETCVGTILAGAIASLQQIKAWGVGEISAALSLTNRRIADQLSDLGLQVPGDHAPHLFGARLPDHYTGDLTGALAAKNVFVSRRGQFVRFAPHLHVTESNLDQLFSALSRELAGAA